MRRILLFIFAVCFCYGSSFSVAAQARKKQQSQRKTSQPAKPPAKISQPQASPVEAAKPQEPPETNKSQAPPAEASKPQAPLVEPSKPPTLETEKPQQRPEEFIKKYFGGGIEQWGQRFGYKGTADKPAPISLLADQAATVMEREGVSALEFFVSLQKFCADASVFWKNGEPQKEIVASYAKRIPLVPASIYREWTEALGKASGYDRLQMMYNLGTIILHDRLFEGGGFSEAEARRLITRLNSIPYAVARQWADAHGSLHTYQAALALLNTDSLFNQDLFQLEAFTKLK